jgi:hypothetical protein
VKRIFSVIQKKHEIEYLFQKDLEKTAVYQKYLLKRVVSKNNGNIYLRNVKTA